jgi:hypothetical protein
VKEVAVSMQQALQTNPPAIPFKKKKKTKSADKDDKDESKSKTIKICINPDDGNSDQIEIKVKIFEDSDTENWIRWRIALDKVIRDAPVTTDPAARTKMAKTLLKGKSHDSFNSHLTNEITNAASDEADEDIFKRALVQYAH